jgi:parvulin-like peptidyl-prolyl isomerase
MNRHASRFVLSVGFLVCLPAAVVWAQGQVKQPASSPSPPIAAVVNGEPVYVATLEAKYIDLAKRQGPGFKPSDKMKAEMLAGLVKRQLIVQALARDKTLVQPDELDRQIAQTAVQIKKDHGVTLEKYAQLRGLTIESLRKELSWKLVWDRYLDRHLSDALEGYFNKHKQDVDGTEVRASHILLRPERYNETTAQIVARANRIRQEVESGKVTFEEAAAKYSVGPSRDKGGDLGFIPRHGVMVPNFTNAAFELEKGEISEPVTTSFGTHLIRVTEIKPGTRQWTEVIPQIKTLASADLFDELAAQEFRKAKIEYTGETPYFKQDTEELVVPAGVKPADTK